MRGDVRVRPSREVKTVVADGQVKVSTVKVALADWMVCIPDHHPGHVSWDQYLATQQRPRANSLSIGHGGGAASVRAQRCCRDWCAAGVWAQDDGPLLRPQRQPAPLDLLPDLPHARDQSSRASRSAGDGLTAP